MLPSHTKETVTSGGIVLANCKCHDCPDSSAVLSIVAIFSGYVAMAVCSICLDVAAIMNKSGFGPYVVC